ncbi:dystonin-like [Asterias rubens]|uniref:dystonin-like n=1 Tax=Asterias rubens TaxID=7604 RepID=UPI0014559A9D|nr:dystonin-like [Asterias rubens]
MMPSPSIPHANSKALAQEVKLKSPSVDKANQNGEELCRISVPLEREVVRSRLDNLNSRFKALADKSADKQGRLSNALASKEVFGCGEASLLRWLTGTERSLAKQQPISIYPEVTKRQLSEHMVQ